ncbi:MAG: hypothetical protein PUA49_09375 [Butyrivibrio sp.]|nr:hypothetical protein [Butyrivibrio sp.]
MEEIVQYTDYTTFKKELDTELTKTAESFVRIGYLLKVARDNPEILDNSGYANVSEMAAAEYGMDKSQVSRFICINDRFSDEGYSDRLKTEYQGYGYAKLAIMITLPDSVVDTITPEYSKSDLLDIKEEIQEANKISPMETYLEGQIEEQRDMTLLEKIVHQMLHDDTKLFENLFTIKDIARDIDYKDEIAPSGDSIRGIRIQGIGRFMLGTKEDCEEISIINSRTGDKQVETWTNMIECIKELLDGSGTDCKEFWSHLYGEEWPEEEKETVAPVQPNQPENNEKKKKKKKVFKTPSKEAKTTQPKIPSHSGNTGVYEDSEPLEGQVTIDEALHEVKPRDFGEQNNTQKSQKSPKCLNAEQIDKMVEEIAQKVVNSKYEFDPSKEYVLLDDVVDILDSWKERCV